MTEKAKTPPDVGSNEGLGLLPEREGQADVMSVAGSGSAMEPDPDAGHWYSPAKVRQMIEDALLAAINEERNAKPVSHGDGPFINCWAVREVFFDEDGNPISSRAP